jgi:hypothetical protein
MSDYKLPKAPLIRVRIMWYWFGQMMPKRILRVSSGYRWRYVRQRLFLRSRGANFMQIYVLCLSTMIRMPWLDMAKRNHMKHSPSVEIDA